MQTRIVPLLVLLVWGCGLADAASRAVVIEVDGCGDAFDTEAGGVVIGPAAVVTVAHAVLQAHEIVVSTGASSLPAELVVLDPRADLALLRVPGIEAPPVDFRDALPGEEGTLHGGVGARALPFVVEQVADLRIEEPLGTDRVLRRGYELRLDARVGDSGAGLFDGEGRLLGIVFAVDSQAPGSAWATAASEIEALVERPEASWACDPDRSRLVRG